MLLSMALCAGAIACAPKTDPYAELKAMEEVFRKMVWEKGEGPEVAAQAQLLRDALVAFVSASPSHPESPVFLHNAASIDADFLNEQQRAATRFGQVADITPTTTWRSGAGSCKDSPWRNRRVTWTGHGRPMRGS